MEVAGQEEVGKMFVGGLSWETTQDAICRYFSRFGEVIDSVVMKNPETGRSRGFGFVTFKDPCCVQIVLESGPHTLDGRTVDPKACNPRTEQKPSRTKDKGQYPKIFLGGLPSNVTETDLKNFFMKYGNVAEVVIMYDQEKKRTRGFGFVSFLTEDCVDRVCAEQYVSINGKQVECKKAEPRESSRGGATGAFNRRGMRSQNGPRLRPGMQQPMGGPPMGPPPMGMPNGMGYQPQGWGPPPPQGTYPSQGAWMPTSAFLGFTSQTSGPTYPSWGPQPGPYGSYSAPGAQFGPPQGYAGYGYNYGWGGQVPAPVPAPSNVNGSVGASQPSVPGAYGTNQQASSTASGSAPADGTGTVAVNQGPSSTANSNATAAVKSEFGAYGSQSYGAASTYSQDSSSYGGTRPYGSDNQGFSSSSGSYVGQKDSSKSNSFAGGAGAAAAGRAASQAYHPYRRP